MGKKKDKSKSEDPLTLKQLEKRLAKVHLLLSKRRDQISDLEGQASWLHYQIQKGFGGAEDTESDEQPEDSSISLTSSEEHSEHLFTLQINRPSRVEIVVKDGQVIGNVYEPSLTGDNYDHVGQFSNFAGGGQEWKV